MSAVVSNILAKVAPNSTISHTIFPPPAKFDPPRDIPDLKGKTVIVTGANTGIGYQTVLQLLLKNAKVYMAARSTSKVQEAAEKLEEETGRKPLQLQLDLGDLHSVRRAAREFLSKEDKLDILFNNAGVMIPPTDQLTSQGYDLQFGVNVLGHYYLTMLLLPALERSTTANGVKARVVNTTSSGHTYATGEGIELSVLKSGPERDAQIKKWGSSKVPGCGAQWHLYGLSKMGNILFTHLLNRHHHDKVAAWSVHPGGISTELQRYGNALEKSMANALLRPAPYGALTQLWAGTMPEAEDVVGAYLIPWARVGTVDPRATNEKTQDNLLAYLEDQMKSFDEPALD
ncbi:NAD(P)-binding protein [Gautieria morchelliformis]|nr:NAD(P)-binding protein [Gautieria morchelliformis]